MATTDDPVPIHRGDLRGLALCTYIPRRGRAARHYADSFSCALWLAKLNVPLPGDGAGAGEVYGEQWGHEMARLVPSDVTVIAYPPAGRKRVAAGHYLARTLAETVAADLELPCVALTWARGGGESSKSIVHHGGKGRALGRIAHCPEDLTGDVVCIIDDLFTTGMTAEVCSTALRAAGATGVSIVALAATELTVDRPTEERRRIDAKRQRQALRRQAREWQCQRGER